MGEIPNSITADEETVTQTKALFTILILNSKITHAATSLQTENFARFLEFPCSKYNVATKFSNKYRVLYRLRRILSFQYKI